MTAFQSIWSKQTAACQPDLSIRLCLLWWRLRSDSFEQNSCVAKKKKTGQRGSDGHTSCLYLFVVFLSSHKQMHVFMSLSHQQPCSCIDVMQSHVPHGDFSLRGREGEARMAHLHRTYTCKWIGASADPGCTQGLETLSLKGFQHPACFKYDGFATKQNFTVFFLHSLIHYIQNWTPIFIPPPFFAWSLLNIPELYQSFKGHRCVLWDNLSMRLYTSCLR